MGLCTTGEKTNMFLFLHRARSSSLKDNLKRNVYFLSSLVQDDRLKLCPGALLWRWLRSIQPLPHPGPWNVSLNFLGASRPPRTLIHTRVCSLGKQTCRCLLAFYHSAFMFQSSSPLLEIREYFKLQWRTTNSEADTIYHPVDFIPET